ncbi:hypothetical protein D0Z08_01060 [Nocardioides immobilis]|uniref:Uncharacterized protein n=1 Tax=Nocardioides immobilis TaxID=2049295 RepID=A0A417Y7D2_9ACTN|nr:hypothetical protein [Nocardioides immobilis]RHW28495.1 hypothetical protein D0Z08_01060 [Nocardioides immobilis]
MNTLLLAALPTAARPTIPSTTADHQGMVEVMAWDDLRGGFNFYRTMPGTTAWVFAGNSRHALVGASRNHGPFESHRNGHFLFKEFKSPWVHWHSPFATVRSSVLAAQGLENHPWVARLEPGGAYTLEERAARPLIRRWTRTRVEQILAGQSEETPGRMLEQLVDTLTVNLVSSFTRGADAVRPAVQVDLPGTFFVDADLLEQVGLVRPPALAVDAPLYAGSLTANGVHLADEDSFRQAGDTHFAFVVPERANEDVVTIGQALEAGLLTRRLVACLLMVDFPNPVFSNRRRALLVHISRVPFDGSGETYSTAVGQAIATSPNATSDDSPEAEFARWWQLGDDFAPTMDQALSEYYSALQGALAGQDGVTAVFRLADARREHVKTMPIAESALLFPTPAQAAMPLRMTPQAEVVPEEEDLS